MKYQKTVDIWSLDESAIKRLQPGQWVTAGDAKGVFCGVKPSGSVVCMWYENAKGRDSYASYRRSLMNYAKGK